MENQYRIISFDVGIKNLAFCVINFNKETKQLEKNNQSKNLAVLCPNHHRYVHYVDMGVAILNYLPPRK